VDEIAEFLAHTPAAKQWERIGVKRHHGIALPLFALRSQKSSGIGEFPDLIPMIKWCKDIGFDTIQLLPLNDAGLSPSPYGALSAQALNPLHLGLSSLPFVTDNGLLQSMLFEIHRLNDTARIHYEELHPLRDHFLKEYYRVYASQLLSTAEYEAFKGNNPWLKNYALFKSIKLCRRWEKWSQWPVTMRDPTPEHLEHLYRQFETDIDYHSLLQFLCFQQMQQVKLFADSRGTFLLGDIPILLDTESCDVWLERDLFDFTYTAGAPPDNYSEKGQNWGFPLYNWAEMDKQGYRWWKERLKAAENLYHMYRIDHVVGLYRIWAIPPSKLPREGHFIPEDPRSWIAHGEEILRHLLDATVMLPIAEDLGTVPPEVRDNLQKLGICGTRVMRWERYWHTEGHPYIPLQNYLPLGITTVSTHDSETLHQWWERYLADSTKYASWRGWDFSLPLSPDRRTALLRDSHHTGTLFHINPLQEYLAHFPELVWANPDMERINIPGTIGPDNWRYRFAATTEDMIENSALAHYMAGLIT
jgi:4-alpha-glucanotransferase